MDDDEGGGPRQFSSSTPITTNSFIHTRECSAAIIFIRSHKFSLQIIPIPASNVFRMPSPVERTVSFDPSAITPKKQVQRRTSFVTISVREYDQTIGDSPSCLDGAPVALGWSFQENRDIPFEEYEQSRQPFRRRRSDLVLGVQERRTKLVESGVSLSEVLKAESFAALKKSASRIRSRQAKTIDRKESGKDTTKKAIRQTAKVLDQKDKPAPSPRSSPPMQKQMASRAA